MAAVVALHDIDLVFGPLAVDRAAGPNGRRSAFKPEVLDGERIRRLEIVE